MSIAININLNKRLIKSSAELYLEVYQNAKEIQELTESAIINFENYLFA